MTPAGLGSLAIIMTPHKVQHYPAHCSLLYNTSLIVDLGLKCTGVPKESQGNSYREAEERKSMSARAIAASAVRPWKPQLPAGGPLPPLQARLLGCAGLDAAHIELFKSM